MRRPALLLALLLGPLQVAAAQGDAPFSLHARELRHAYAVDLIGLHLDVLELEPSSEDEETGVGEDGEAEEGEAGLLETALPLMAGSLEARDAALLGELETALAEAEGGNAAAQGEARQLLARAQTVLIPADLSRDPAFRAARLALLASLEPGVGEGYEEAAQGEEEAYLVAWTSLGRLKELWAELEPELGNADTESITRAFSVLDSLIASPQPPERFSDPEDAEGAVNDLIFGLEAATGATLLPRDFAAMTQTLSAHVKQGCAAAEEEEARLALEWAGAARFFYEAYLADTLAMLGPEANARITEELGAFADAPLSEETPARCEILAAAFGEARAVFGG